METQWGRIPRARVPPGLAPIYLGDQRQQFALAATNGRVHGVDRRHQMRIGMEVVPTHAATNRSGGGTEESVSNMCSLVKSFGLSVRDGAVRRRRSRATAWDPSMRRRPI